jgi:hypothetical protein
LLPTDIGRQHLKVLVLALFSRRGHGEANQDRGERSNCQGSS